MSDLAGLSVRSRPMISGAKASSPKIAKTVKPTEGRRCYTLGRMSGTPKQATLRFYRECLLRVLIHIQQHLDEPLELQELARLACLAPHHFHHVFTGMLSEPLAGHVRRLRLERAAVRLKHTDFPVVQIALEAGYETHEAFSRAFRKNFGLSPVQFRSRNGLTTRIKAACGVHYSSGSRVRDFTSTQTGPGIEVTIKRLGPIRVAFMRHIGPYDQVGQTWEQLLMLLGKEGRLDGTAQFIGICHDDPAVSPAHKIRYDACVSVDASFRPRGEIGVQTIPQGDYAVMTHLGPYEELGQSYAKLLGEWLPRSGRRLRPTPCFEIYFNSPENTDPKDLVTDIHAALENR